MADLPPPDSNTIAGMPPQNIVLVVMDTARADDVFGTVDGTAVTPELDSLAEDSTRYNNAYAAAPWTLPSHGSLFTGTYPSKHGAHAGHKRLDDSLPTMAELFSDAGYETVAVSNNTWVSEEFGFGRGFEQFYKTWQHVQSDTDLGRIAREYNGREQWRPLAGALFDGNPLVNLWNAIYGQFFRKRDDDGARRTNRWLDEWLTDRETDRPFFLFCNYLEPHLPYDPPKEYTEPFLPPDTTYEAAQAVPQEPWAYIAGQQEMTDADFAALRALYRGELAYLDARLGYLQSMLAEAGVWDETVFVVIGDHGENVGDHGLMDHQYCLYETLTKVPMLVHGGPFATGETRDDLVQLTDLLPTLLDTTGIDPSSAELDTQGVSFHPESGDDPRDAVFAEYLATQPSMEALQKQLGSLPEQVTQYDRSLRAVRTAEYKLVCGSDGARELYHVTTDPTEETDIASEAEEHASRLETRLEAWLDSFDHADVTADIDIATDTQSRLEDLGYLQ